MEIPTVHFQSDTLQDSITSALKREGVVVVENVFSPEECDAYMEGIVNSLRLLCDDSNLSIDTWVNSKLPSGTRSGMMQSLVGHLPIVWKVRSDNRIYKIFRAVYSGLRNRDIDRFVTSCDGICIKPPIRPFAKSKVIPHVDQTTDTDNIFKCVQGQVVLSTTTAAFVCSPRSHSYLEKALAMDNSKRGNEFHQFSKDTCKKIQRFIEEKGGRYQVPVHTQKGSVILWLSSLLHFSKFQDKCSVKEPSDLWSQWRGIIYISYRPREDVTSEHCEFLQRAFKENRVTNHWGTKLFPKRLGTDFTKRTGRIAELLKDPSKVYRIEGLRPEQTPQIDALLQGKAWPTDALLDIVRANSDNTEHNQITPHPMSSLSTQHENNKIERRNGSHEQQKCSSYTNDVLVQETGPVNSNELARAEYDRDSSHQSSDPCKRTDTLRRNTEPLSEIPSSTTKRGKYIK
eukprot:gene7107-437_t